MITSKILKSHIRVRLSCLTVEKTLPGARSLNKFHFDNGLVVGGVSVPPGKGRRRAVEVVANGAVLTEMKLGPSL